MKLVNNLVNTLNDAASGIAYVAIFVATAVRDVIVDTVETITSLFRRFAW